MLGIDIEDNSRFKDKSDEFYNRIFTKNEMEYCKSKTNYAAHFCARYCAKEAVIKALSYKNIKISGYNVIEVYHGKFNEPRVRILDTNIPKYNIRISIAHEKDKSVAVAFIIE